MSTRDRRGLHLVKAVPPPPQFHELPFNLAAEQAVLGFMLGTGRGMDLVRQHISGPEDFHEPVHQRIYQALLLAHQDGRATDWTSVVHLFDADPALGQLGRSSWLKSMAEAAVVVIDVTHSARIVAELAVKRRVLVKLEELQGEARNGTAVRSLLGKLKETADDLAASSLAGDRVRALFRHEWKLPSKPRLVDGFMGHDYFAILYGPSFAGKSFFAIDMAMSIAYGRSWRGRRTDHGLVVYVAAEAASSVQRRAMAWLERYASREPEAPAFVIVPGPVDIMRQTGDAQAIIAACRKASAACCLPVRLVIVDTLAAACPGSKEDSEDFGAAIGNMHGIMADLSCSMMVIHHSGKQAGQGARGHSSLAAAADLTIEIVEEQAERAAKQPIVRKLRDGKEPQLWPYEIEDQTIAVDEDGMPVTAGVPVILEPIEDVDSDLDDERLKQVRSLKAEGLSTRQIGLRLSITHTMVQKILNRGRGRP